MKLSHAIAFFLTLSLASARIGGDDEAHHDPRFLHASTDTKVVRGHYIIRFEDSVTDPKGLVAALLKANPKASITHEYTTIFRGYSVKDLPESSMHDFLHENPGVSMTVEEDRVTKKTAVPWSLDRIDERDLPLDNKYVTPNGLDGTGVDIYILDTGVRATHNEFTGRIKPGVNYANDGFGANDDPDGHGTHVASSAAGTQYGVAKKANIISVRVLDKDGDGLSSDTIKGLDFVASKHGPGKKTVANLSLGGGFSQAENDAVKKAVEKGVVVVVAAGNDGRNACLDSPGSEPLAITVGMTASNDRRDTDSNFGRCVDLFAPGVDIRAASSSSDSATVLDSGTSMACPHVAGAAALLLQADPSKTGAAAATALINMATTGKIPNPGSQSPNKLLYIGGIQSSNPTPPTSSPSAASVEISVTYDNFPEETSFGIEKKVGGQWSGVYDKTATTSEPSTFVTTQALSDGEYRFYINDSEGDGICCHPEYGNGSYKLTDKSKSNNKVFATGGEFASVERKLFTVANGEVTVGTTNPAPSPTPPAPAPTPAPPVPTPSASVDFKITVVYDNYPEETVFSLEQQQANGSWTKIHSEEAPPANSNPSPKTVTKSLANGTYRFVIEDISQYLDGICCQEGNGSFTLTAGGTQLAQGGEFTDKAVVVFAVSNGNASVISSTP